MDARKQHPTKPAVNRIIVGDVGSGKTIVAFVIILVYLKSLGSEQVALLAPTEILARQHYDNLLQLVGNGTFRCVYYTSKEKLIGADRFTPKQFDNSISQLIQDTPVIWVGTHALLHNDIIQPSMVIVDEQHRFGVNQRKHLARTQKNSETYSHFVSLTATPIPRTLALTVFKSLKPHFLTTLPGRNTIRTEIVDVQNMEDRVLSLIESEIAVGHKAYVICPKIEHSDEDEVWSLNKAEKYFETHFPSQVMSVHGKKSQKQDIIKEFRDSQNKHILVSTTVVEVGVDIPTATVMIILNSERFGLAALHQIRGRIGRNNLESNVCMLVTANTYSRRLQYLQQSNNGFDIAEKDLELRGSGSLIGSLQSGFDEDIEALLGLDTLQYQSLSSMVEDLDMSSLAATLPRLDAYLKKESQKIWEE